MKRVIRVLLIGCVVVSFILFLKSTDIHESIHLILHLNPSIAFVLVSTFFAYLFATYGWIACIESDVKIPVYKMFMYRHVGNIITLFNPSAAIAGEAFNAKMLINNGVEKKEAYKSVLLSRIMMIVTQLVLFVFIIVWFLFDFSDRISEPVKLIFYLTLFVIVCIVSVITWWMMRKKKNRYEDDLEKRWRKTLSKIAEVRIALKEYLILHPRKAAKAYFFFTLHWIVGSLELYIILSALGYDVNILDGLFLDTLIIVSKSAVSFIPGQIGAEEIINKFALLLMTFKSSTLWLSVSILRRTRLLFWSIVAVLFYLIIARENRKLNKSNL